MKNAVWSDFHNINMINPVVFMLMVFLLLV